MRKQISISLAFIFGYGPIIFTLIPHYPVLPSQCWRTIALERALFLQTKEQNLFIPFNKQHKLRVKSINNKKTMSYP